MLSNFGDQRAIHIEFYMFNFELHYLVLQGLNWLATVVKDSHGNLKIVMNICFDKEIL